MTLFSRIMTKGILPGRIKNHPFDTAPPAPSAAPLALVQTWMLIKFYMKKI